jgi:hypothetical protein
MSADQLAAQIDAAAPRPTIFLRHIAAIVAERREPRWLLHRVLECGVLAVLAGPRGTFKSFVALDWSMRAAVAGHPALILSGEGAGLDRRVDAWMRVHGAGITLEELPIRALERPLRLTAGGDLAELVEVIEAAPPRPNLIVIDTMSKYAAGLDENDNAKVAEYLGDLATGLRDRFDAAVLLVAHSGHGDSKRPRGASALMCNPDAEYIITKCRGVNGFYGASSVERLPAERAIAEQIRTFKRIRLPAVAGSTSSAKLGPKKKAGARAAR